jgi:hypothetical protein
MRPTITFLHRAIPAVGVVQLVLGLLFWTGNARALVDLHELLGVLLVLGLWTLAVLAHRAGVPGWLVAGAAVYGLVVPIVGFTQQALLPGAAHWVVQVVHLLLGIGLIGLAEHLATRAKARLAPVAQRVSGNESTPRTESR